MSILDDILRTITGGGGYGGRGLADLVSKGSAAALLATGIEAFVDNADKLVPALQRLASLLGDYVLGGYLGGLTGAFLLGITNALGYSTLEQLYAFLRNLQLPRRLLPQEKALVEDVFQGTVPTNRIWITPFLGLRGLPFTIPFNLIATPLILRILSPQAPELAASLSTMILAAGLLPSSGYLINMGPHCYAGDATGLCPDVQPQLCSHEPNVGGRVLIHETTHVWQGEHWPFPLQYVFDSVIDQVSRGFSPYSLNYNPNVQWNSYGAEGQAVIVERWFSGQGPVEAECPHDYVYAPKDCRNPLYRFLVANVRTGNNRAPSDESLLCPGPSFRPKFRPDLARRIPEPGGGPPDTRAR